VPYQLFCGIVRRMATDVDSQAPQFQTVEYATSVEHCALCSQALGPSYYLVNGERACGACVERERLLQRDSNKHYPRALLFSIGAAVLGLIGYATFAIVTGIVIGFASLAVGWLVGKAMMKGARGVGGRKYQVTAVVLTYAAVSLAAVPIAISQFAQARSPATASSTPAPSSQPPATAGTSKTCDHAGDRAAPMSFGRAVGMLALLGLASPFLELTDPFHGLIGLFILFIGLQIAWRITGRPPVSIDGPF
jgi:hypothetical protein